MNSMRPTIIDADQFEKPEIEQNQIQTDRLAKINLKIGGKFEQHRPICHRNQDQPFNSLGMPLGSDFAGDTFQPLIGLQVEQDAVVQVNSGDKNSTLRFRNDNNSEEDSVCFQLSQSGGLDTKRTGHLNQGADDSFM
jgi:hypothetical protein